MQNIENTNIVIRQMRADQICMIEQVDRSESVEAEYIAQQSADGMSLALRRVERDPPKQLGPWSRKAIDRRIADWRPKVENGGLLLGAFDGQRLVGFAALGPKLSDDSAELVALFVGANHRRLGIGSLLMKEVEKRAGERRIRALFVASNPTPSAVEFYLKQGCRAITLRQNSIIKHRIGDPIFAKEL